MMNQSKIRLFEMMEKLNPEIKKHKISEGEIKKDIDYGVEGGIINDVKFYGDCKMVDIGVGSYEFGGTPGFDKRMVGECDNITWDKTEYSAKENELIEKYLNDNYDEIKLAMEEKYEDEN